MGFGNLTSIKLLRDRPDRPGERAAMDRADREYPPRGVNQKKLAPRQ